MTARCRSSAHIRSLSWMAWPVGPALCAAAGYGSRSGSLSFRGGRLKVNNCGFSVATNFDDGLIDALSAYPVTEVFGKLSSDPVGGGRASFALPPLSRRRFERHVKAAGAKGIGFNYLLNPACMDNREYTRQGQRDLEALLEYIEAAGVSAVTISLPFLLPLIKKRHPRLKVRVGVYARVDGVAKAKFWEDGGADCITLESLS